MKRRNLAILLLITSFLFLGCTKSKEGYAKISFEPLSEREEEILSLTENRVFLYKIKNIPKGKYKITLNYERYKGGEEVKKEPILTLLKEEGEKEISLGINFKGKNKINCILGEEGSYSNTSYETEENIEEYARGSFSGKEELNLEPSKRLILYYGTLDSIGFSNKPIGDYMDSEYILDEFIKGAKEGVFLTLSLDKKE